MNRALGCTTSDDLLVQAAQRLAGLSRPGRLIARLGSDRFAILTDDGGEAMDLAGQALSRIAEPFPLGDRNVAITASAGVADGSTPQAFDTLMGAANSALHWAKSDGRGVSRLFDPQRNAEDVKRSQLWLALSSAITYDQVTLHYQPLVELDTGRILGAEALARWSHPTFGEVPPDTFIAIAEETGLIVPLGTMLLRKACAAAARWEPRDGAPAPFISVNVASAQLRVPDFLEAVGDILACTGLAPERLQLEITEHTVLGTDEQTMRNLRGLAELGVRIAIDDFGTGYSNLSTLRNLPVHELKLAHSFVQEGSRDFLNTIMLMGRSLNLTMTAEGIETKDQADMMRNLGCDAGQGWHFSRPMTADKIRDYLCVRPNLQRRRRSRPKA